LYHDFIDEIIGKLQQRQENLVVAVG